MSKTVIAAVFMLGMAAGCATEIVEVPLPADHPASPSAAPAPRPPMSDTLHIEHTVPPPQEDPQPDPAHAQQGAPDPHAAHQPAATTPAPATQPATTHVCPMHPEVTQPAPGTCPKCGMKLVPKEAAAQHEHGGRP